MSLAPSPLPARAYVCRRAAALAGAVLALTLTACSQTGFGAQTNARYDPGVGSNEAFGDVPVLAVLVVDNGNSTGTLSATLTRRTPDEVSLTGVTATSTEGDRIKVSFDGELEIPPNADAQPLVLTSGEPIVLSGEAVRAGNFVNVAFELSSGQSVSLDAPVVSRPDEGGLYADVPDDSGTPPQSPSGG